MNSSQQFIVFCAVGIISAILDVVSLLELVQQGVAPYFAVTIAFFFGLVVNLWLHAHLTFRTRVNTQNALRFLMVIVINYLLTMGFVFLFEQLGLSYLIGKIISLPLVAIHGFLWSRLWVFKP
jgi:putative flippase GtrA